MPPNQLRIIGGKWRHRRLSINPYAGLRPTPNRVRETLFNWLTPTIQGATCLDAFAGSGALGLEALSRGARQVYFIDQAYGSMAMLQQHLTNLACDHAAAPLIQATLPAVLTTLTQAFDVVFIDPPFDQGLVEPTLTALLNQRLLKPNALVYTETERHFPLAPLRVQHWRIRRHSHAGAVAYYLLERAL